MTPLCTCYHWTSPIHLRKPIFLSVILLNISNLQVQNLLNKGEEDSTTNVTVSVIFYFTQDFKDATADVSGYVEGLIETTNIAFLRSRIPVRLAIHCIMQAEIGEAPESTDRIREFKESQGKKDQ